MARDDEANGLRVAYDFQRSLVGNGSLTEESFKSSQSAAKELYSKLLEVLSPWMKTEDGKIQEDTLSSLINLYKTVVGDPDEPEFRKKLIHDMEMLEKGRAEPAIKESEEERIERLMAARQNAYKAKGITPK